MARRQDNTQAHVGRFIRFPEPLYRDIEKRARTERRTTQAQIITELERALKIETRA